MTTTSSPLSLTLSYAPAISPPASGHSWDDDIDYPGVMAAVSLPTNEHSFGKFLSRDLVEESQACCGQYLSSKWGDVSTNCRVVSRTFRAPTLAAAEAAARAWHAEGAAVIAGIVARRNARLVRREATIAAAHAVHGEVAAPSE
jgi:hypothetical protein